MDLPEGSFHDAAKAAGRCAPQDAVAWYNDVATPRARTLAVGVLGSSRALGLQETCAWSNVFAVLLDALHNPVLSRSAARALAAHIPVEDWTDLLAGCSAMLCNRVATELAKSKDAARAASALQALQECHGLPPKAVLALARMTGSEADMQRAADLLLASRGAPFSRGAPLWAHAWRVAPAVAQHAMLHACRTKAKSNGPFPLPPDDTANCTALVRELLGEPNALSNLLGTPYDLSLSVCTFLEVVRAHPEVAVRFVYCDLLWDTGAAALLEAAIRATPPTDLLRSPLPARAAALISVVKACAAETRNLGEKRQVCDLADAIMDMVRAALPEYRAACTAARRDVRAPLLTVTGSVPNDDIVGVLAKLNGRVNMWAPTTPDSPLGLRTGLRSVVRATLEAATAGSGAPGAQSPYHVFKCWAHHLGATPALALDLLDLWRGLPQLPVKAPATRVPAPPVDGWENGTWFASTQATREDDDDDDADDDTLDQTESSHRLAVFELLRALECAADAVRGDERRRSHVCALVCSLPEKFLTEACKRGTLPTVAFLCSRVQQSCVALWQRGPTSPKGMLALLPGIPAEHAVAFVADAVPKWVSTQVAFHADASPEVMAAVLALPSSVRLQAWKGNVLRLSSGEPDAPKRGLRADLCSALLDDLQRLPRDDRVAAADNQSIGGDWKCGFLADALARFGQAFLPAMTVPAGAAPHGLCRLLDALLPRLGTDKRAEAKFGAAMGALWELADPSDAPQGSTSMAAFVARVRKFVDALGPFPLMCHVRTREGDAFARRLLAYIRACPQDPGPARPQHEDWCAARHPNWLLLTERPLEAVLACTGRHGRQALTHLCDDVLATWNSLCQEGESIAFLQTVTSGVTAEGVAAFRRANPGGKLPDRFRDVPDILWFLRAKEAKCTLGLVHEAALLFGVALADLPVRLFDSLLTKLVEKGKAATEADRRALKHALDSAVLHGSPTGEPGLAHLVRKTLHSTCAYVLYGVAWHTLDEGSLGHLRALAAEEARGGVMNVRKAAAALLMRLPGTRVPDILAVMEAFPADAARTLLYTHLCHMWDPQAACHDMFAACCADGLCTPHVLGAWLQAVRDYLSPNRVAQELTQFQCAGTFDVIMLADVMLAFPGHAGLGAQFLALCRQPLEAGDDAPRVPQAALPPLAARLLRQPAGPEVWLLLEAWSRGEHTAPALSQALHQQPTKAALSPSQMLVLLHNLVEGPRAARADAARCCVEHLHVVPPWLLTAELPFDTLEAEVKFYRACERLLHKASDAGAFESDADRQQGNASATPTEVGAHLEALAARVDARAVVQLLVLHEAAALPQAPSAAVKALRKAFKACK